MVLGIFHHAGTFLLFSAAVLLLVVTLSAPIIHHLDFLRVHYNDNANKVSFGTFGYCEFGSGTHCSSSRVGYNPLQYLEDNSRGDYGGSSMNTSKALTRVMVLHAVAAALAWIAFFLALGAGLIGSIAASATALLAWLVALIVTITDFVGWGIVRNRVNRQLGKSQHASWGAGIWITLAAMICLFLAMFLVLFACCQKRRKERGTRTTTTTKHHSRHEMGQDPMYNGGAAPYRKKHFWQRSSRTTRY